MSRLRRLESGRQSNHGGEFLEQHSRTEDTPQARRILEGHVRECYGRVVYSHKTHEKCADLLLTKHARIKLGQILLSAVTTAGFIGAILGTGPWAAVAGGLVSIGLLTLNAYTKNYDLGELAQKHRNAANELWIVRERYLALLVDIAMREKPIESLQAQRDEITSQLHKVYSGAPSTNNPAYKKAQTALKTLEDMTFSDAEIDAFLPGELKRSSQVQAVLDAEVSKLVQPLRGASDGKL